MFCSYLSSRMIMVPRRVKDSSEVTGVSQRYWDLSKIIFTGLRALSSRLVTLHRDTRQFLKVLHQRGLTSVVSSANVRHLTDWCSDVQLLMFRDHNSGEDAALGGGMLLRPAPLTSPLGRSELDAVEDKMAGFFVADLVRYVELENSGGFGWVLHRGLHSQMVPLDGATNVERSC